MSEVTYIKGKDACLEDSINRLQNTLKTLGYSVEESSWLNPVKNVYSLHVTESSCKGLFTNGKGASRKATLASALGEFLERLSTNYFFSDYYLQPGVAEHHWLYYPNEKQFSETDIQHCLSPELWSVYTQNGEFGFDELVSFNDSDDAVRAIPLINQSTGETVYFPMNLLSNLYASNGLSAGNTALEAKVQGLSEIFERWVKNKILRENICLPEIPDQVVAKYPAIVEAINSLKAAGIELSIRDASLGGKYPVINVTLFEQSSGRCFASFGAHPILEVALERTLTESLQGRHLNDLDGFQIPVFDEIAVAEDENIENHFIDSSGLIHAKFISKNYDYDFVEWNFSDTTESEWQALLTMVKEQGAEVYVANYNHCGFEACRIIVPGMSEIYPPTELLDNNQNEGRLLREALLKLPQSLDYIGLVDLIDEVGFSAHQGIASIIGLMPDPGSYWGQLKVCDLRFWALLAGGDLEEALEAVHEVEYFLDPKNSRAQKYQAAKFCLQMQLEVEVDTDSSELLFGKTLSDWCWQSIRGEVVFDNQPLGMDIFSSSRAHQSLLGIYKNLHEIKLKAFK
jgi:ribosomal protein S12 methylthiotransferase accessory factor